jgi:hypothetical protein
MVQEQKVLGMSIRPEAEFAPLDITNLADALISVTFPTKHVDQDQDDSDRMDHNIRDGSSSSVVVDDTQRFDGQIYTLTGPETTTGPKLVEELNRAIASVSREDEYMGGDGSKVHPNDSLFYFYFPLVSSW